MEDIKILEEFIKYFEAEAMSRKYRRNISITVGEDDIEAIENLIARNKELESALKNSVSKDEIKAKIEELNDGIKRDMINYDKIEDKNWKLAIHRSMTQKIETKKVLQELLNKGE